MSALIALLLPVLAAGQVEVVPRVVDADAAPDADATDWAPSYALEAAVVTTTRGASSGVQTDLFPGIGLRGGVSVRPWALGPGALELGVDGQLLVSQDTRGTRAVRVARSFLTAGARLRLGYALGGMRFGATPFLFAEAGAGPGVSAAKVLAQVRLTPILGHWARAGVGLRIRLWGVLVGLDVAAGQHTLRPALSSWATVGWAL